MPKSPVDKPIARINPDHRVEEALASLEAALGGRSKIIATLMQLTPGEDETNFMEMLADPRNDTQNLAKVAALAGLSVGRVLQIFKEAKGAEAYVRSINRVYDRLPEIAGDIADRSVPTLARCAPCRGTGVIDSTTGQAQVPGADPAKLVDCWPCEGTGKVTVLPDLERQKLALQIGGLVKKDGTVIMGNVDARVTNNAFIRTTPDWRTATDRLLFPGKARETAATVVDAEIVDAEVGSAGEES